MMKAIACTLYIVIFFSAFGQSSAGISLGKCSLSCSENEDSAVSVLQKGYASRLPGPPGKSGAVGPEGSRGPMGQRGPPGAPGAACDCTKYDELAADVDNSKKSMQKMNGLAYASSCRDLHELIKNSGTFIIFPFKDDSKGIQVYCEQHIDGGGWIVIQRRLGGPEDFYRDWDDYVSGFGDKGADMWLGLKIIHLLTKNGLMELRVDLQDQAGNRAYAKYSSFSIADSDDNYRLNISGYSGNAGDGLANQNGMQFSSKNRDNDVWPRQCATEFKGAWWYRDCHHSNLNGLYGGANAQGVSWYDWKNTHESLKKAEMKIRMKI